MAMLALDRLVKEALASKASVLEEHFAADCVFYYGPFFPSLELPFREFIETLKGQEGGKEDLVLFLNSPGGDVVTVEKLVEIIRYHYRKLYFVVPDEAMSAGTIFCMAGDRIYMDYSSSLGPIDPQVYNEEKKEFVPALGYLDQIQRVLDDSADGKKLTEADFSILTAQDLAWLSKLEQAKNLTITLLKKWLVEYKFQDWTVHQSNSDKNRQPVTLEEKQERAEEIAKMLSDNKKWHSHARKIGIKTLVEEIRLKVEDYSKEAELRSNIRAYNDLFINYINNHGYPYYIHSRHNL